MDKKYYIHIHMPIGNNYVLTLKWYYFTEWMGMIIFTLIGHKYAHTDQVFGIKIHTDWKYTIIMFAHWLGIKNFYI